MPAGAAAWGPTASPSRGLMALGWAMLVMLVLSTLQACGAVPLVPGQQRGVQWVWGSAGQAQAESPLLSRARRGNAGQQPSATTTMSEHGQVATIVPNSNKADSPEPDLLLRSVPPPAPGTNANLHQAPTVPATADPLSETHSSKPNLLQRSVPPPAPGTNASLHQAPTVPATADPLDETHSSKPNLLQSSVPPPAPGTNASLHQAPAAPTTADPLDETYSPDPDLLQSSVPAPGTNTSLHEALAAPPTSDPLDKTDSPGPDLLRSSAPLEERSTQAAPQKSPTAVTSQPTLPGEEGTVTSGLDSSSAPTPALSPTTTGYKNNTGTPPAPTRCDTTPWGTTVLVPWEPSRATGKCLLVILLLALVAAVFLVSTGVLGALLWRRSRTAHRRLSPTEMICISSLLPDGEVATNRPRSGPIRRQKLLPDGDTDGDTLTLSSFLPEHS